ncbi:hypothetical protein [Mycoplasma sp. 21DD0573]|uniref:hypothetical protein n=1 Tax=unclassified Mycoplasma TaxID=2683645 RepID=UPI002B1D3063|nr:hypothetical protein [Mycoplasma sp. 21DD0573]MEA4276460.1 hypothetical protein [Mycoplasma sp. 21DD0573]
MYYLGFFSPVSNPGWKRAAKNFTNMFSFESYNKNLTENLWELNFKYFIQTVKTITCGSILGFLAALFTGFFASTNIHKHKSIPLIIKIILLLLRAFPVIVFLLLFRISFDPYLAAFTIYFWFTWLWLHKYINDLIEAADTKKYWNDIAKGSSKLKSFYTNIVLVLKNKFWVNFFLSYESNIRWVSVLGIVGINGLGFFFGDLSKYQKNIGITLFFIFLFILINEGLLFFFNKVLFVKPNITINSKADLNKFKYNWRKYAFWFILAIYFGIFIWSLTGLFHSKVDVKTFSLFFKSLFIWDFSDVVKTDIYKDYLYIFMCAYVAVALAFIFAIAYSFILSENLFNSYLVWSNKTILIIIKIIPAVIWFYMFNPLMKSQVAITSAILISSFRHMCKQFAESINSIDRRKISNMQAQGNSKWFIYRNFIIPQIKNQIISTNLFEYEKSFRNAIIYGAFANISIYKTINKYQETQEYSKIVPLILPAYVFLIMLELAYLILKNKDKLKFYINNSKLWNSFKKQQNFIPKSQDLLFFKKDF